MKNILEDKHICLGVTGSIACYKAIDLASKLTQAGAKVDVLLTRGAREFVSALAFRAITLEPARLLKIDDRVGSLEKGKDADIIIWSGHPLHYRSFVMKAWVDGKLYYEKEKSPLFREIPLR